MTRSTRGLLVLLPALLLAGCGEDVVSPEQAVAGTYTLVSANGNPPPATVFSQEQKGVLFEARITAGSLALDGERYDIELRPLALLNGDPVPGSDEPLTDSGTYTVSGATITLRNADGTTTTGTLAGDEITFSETDEIGGQSVSITLVYRK